MTEYRNIAVMLARHLLRRERMRELLLAPRRGWGPRAMANICIALREELVARSEVMAAHDISAAELDDWIARYDRGGAEALKVKRWPGRAA